MINVGPLRAVFEADGHVIGLRKFRHLLGLADEHGNRYFNDKNEPVIRNPYIKSSELNLRVLAEAIGGAGGVEWTKIFEPGYRSGAGAVALEAGSATAVQPSAFNNTNAWNAAAGGLLEIKVLEGYQDPAFIGDELMETVQSAQRSEKMPGVARIGDESQKMNPGQSHPRVQLSERYVETPPTEKFGLGIDVTREAVFFDITGQVQRQAEDLGHWIRLRKEKRQLRLALGIENSYRYNGTAYDTYLTAGNWINEHTNQLDDWTDVDAAFQLFAEMKDQETGERISITGPFQLLVMPFKLMTARKMLTDTAVQRRTDSSANVAEGANPLIGMFEGGAPLSSPIAYQLLTDAQAAGGAGLTTEEAKHYWYMGQFKRAFQYKQNFPFRVDRVDANDYQMKDADLLLSVFADEMGTPAVIEPRYVVRSVTSQG